MIAIMYLAFTIFLCFIYGEKIKDLEKRIKELEFFLSRDEEWIKNEADN